MIKKIFLIGMMGAGKSFQARKLANALQIVRYDLDTWIESKEKMTIQEIFANKGESYFREMESEAIKEISKQESFVLATGGGAPCFHQNMEWMNEHGLTIWLNPKVSILFGRLRNATGKRPLLNGLSENELRVYIEQKLEERSTFYRQAKIIVNDEQMNTQKLVDIINNYHE